MFFSTMHTFQSNLKKLKISNRCLCIQNRSILEQKNIFYTKIEISKTINFYKINY